MKKLIGLVIGTLALLSMLTMPFSATYAVTEEQKIQCATMIRFGKEALQRSKYDQAKDFFKRAIQYDPTNKTAWKYYDQSSIFSLAVRVQSEPSLTKTDTSLKLTSNIPPSTISSSAEIDALFTNAASDVSEMTEALLSGDSSEISDEEEEEEEEGC